VEVIMKQVGIFFVLVVAGIMLALGLLFLCASAEDPGRLPLSVILLVGGGAAALWAGRTLRRAYNLAPGRLAERITALARAHDAEVTLPQVMADLNAPREEALAALNLLEERGATYREFRGERELYVFPDLLPSKVVRRCPYCGSQFSVKTPIYKCPHCGGAVEIEKQ
jgi:DNA-directed RNA polymerase subunit RPC12/RpoP